jgi:hypothetical protein
MKNSIAIIPYNYILFDMLILDLFTLTFVQYVMGKRETTQSE